MLPGANLPCKVGILFRLKSNLMSLIELDFIDTHHRDSVCVATGVRRVRVPHVGERFPLTPQLSTPDMVSSHNA